MNSRKVILIIMDGWGISENPDVSAIEAAHTPWYDQALQTYPWSRLQASGEAVGLPAGQMGNSEVGHMNIGAGRIVYQDLAKISREINSGAFANNAGFKNVVDTCESKQKPLHILGLLSDGGVHSHIDHLKGILSSLQGKNIPGIFLHLFTDGRDTDPNGGKTYLADLEQHIQTTQTGKIASLIGRYFSMDRNQKYDRIKKSWDLLVKGEGEAFPSADAAISASYERGISDEFVEPMVIHENGQPVATIKEGDAVLFFNFRTDRGRQLTRALTQENMPEEGMHTLQLHYSTMTRYDETFEGVEVLYDKENIQKSLGETLAAHGKTQIRIAETEKYPHVTFFFNGGKEEPFSGEERILCPSPKVATYDLQPEMSAFEIRDKITPKLQAREPDFVCLNFANPDMVGHTGVFEAAVKACETVDLCTSQLVETALANGYTALVTADHGNADRMKNPDGTPHTAHTTTLVPLFLIEPKGEKHSITDGKLGDLAPTILTLMDVPIPEEMSGNVLISE